MPGTPAFDGLAVGDVVAERVVRAHPRLARALRRRIRRLQPHPLPRRRRASVGLPGVLAHGMLTMGFAVQPVVDWVGDPGRVLDYQVRFTRPVVVDPEIGAMVSVVAKVGARAEARAARIDLTVTFNGETVLGKAQARVSLD